MTKEQIIQQMEAESRKIGRAIGSQLPKQFGFALLIFEFNGTQSTYISNCDRADMIKALRELADRIERHADTKPFTQN